jgi:predicted nicotinamide N-methyase
VGRVLGPPVRAAPRSRRRRGRPVRGALNLVEEEVELGAGLRLEILRPPSADELIDETAFDEEEFLPYWAELWPAATALAAALPAVAGLRVVELGCGLGLPSLVAAARGAEVTATDWAAEAIELLRENAARNGLSVNAEVRDWREPWPERFDLALAADVLYERRNVEPLLERLRELAPLAYVGLAGRPYEGEFLRRAGSPVEIAGRVVALGLT